MGRRSATAVGAMVNYWEHCLVEVDERQRVFCGGIYVGLLICGHALSRTGAHALQGRRCTPSQGTFSPRDMLSANRMRAIDDSEGTTRVSHRPGQRGSAYVPPTRLGLGLYTSSLLCSEPLGSFRCTGSQYRSKIRGQWEQMSVDTADPVRSPGHVHSLGCCGRVRSNCAKQNHDGRRRHPEYA